MRIARMGSVVRESYDCIIGDAPSGAIPFGRRVRCKLVGSRVMPVSEPAEATKPAGLSQLNLNAAVTA